MPKPKGHKKSCGCVVCKRLRRRGKRTKRGGRRR